LKREGTRAAVIMDGEQRLILLLSLLATILLALLGLVLLIAMWPQREIIGSVLIGLVVLMFLLVIGVTVNEQVLRHKRIKYQTELPLVNGSLVYLPKDMQIYQGRHPYD
jgi:hypothetical protein